MKRIGALLIFFMMISTMGIAQGTTPSAGNTSKREAAAHAEKALEALRQAYLAKNADSFFQKVDPSPYFSAGDLRARITSDFSRFDLLDLHFIVDHRIKERDQVVLRLHWQKRVVRNETGKVELSEGRTELVFRVHGVQASLLNILKENPF